MGGASGKRFKSRRLSEVEKTQRVTRRQILKGWGIDIGEAYLVSLDSTREMIDIQNIEPYRTFEPARHWDVTLKLTLETSKMPKAK